MLNGQKEIWVQVLEKAVATLGGGYNSIANGGNPMIAMEELTGQAATYMSPSALTVQELQGLHGGRRPDRDGHSGVGQPAVRPVQRPRLHVRQRDHGQRHGHGAIAQSVGLRRALSDPAVAACRPESPRSISASSSPAARSSADPATTRSPCPTPSPTPRSISVPATTR